MKTYRHLWPRLCDFENLYYAWQDARRGKASKAQVLRFEANLEDNLCSLQDELAAGTYRPLPYTNFYVYEKKRRLVSAADLRDRARPFLCVLCASVFQPGIQNTEAQR